MILLCPNCHVSVIESDTKVMAAGGPETYPCAACGTALGNIETVLGITFAHTQKDDSAMLVADTGTTSPAITRTDDDDPDKTLSNVDPKVLTFGAPRMRQGLKSQNGSGPATDPVRTTLPEAPQLSNALLPVDPEEDEIQWESAVRRTAPSGPFTQPTQAVSGTSSGPVLYHPTGPGRRSGGMRFFAGCATAGAFILAVAGIGVAAWYFGFDGEWPDFGEKTGANTQSQGSGKTPAQSARPPLADRLQEIATVSSEVSIPAVALPDRPVSGEVVLTMPAGIVFDGKTVAGIALGRVDPSTRPGPTSPLVLPLARALQAAFRRAEETNPDAIPADRMLLVMLDSNVPYRAFFPTLYTGHQRGARIALVTRHHQNPNAFASVEVLPHNWPTAEDAGAPEDLPTVAVDIGDAPPASQITVFIKKDRLDVVHGVGPGLQRVTLDTNDGGAGWTQLGKLSDKLRRDGARTVLIKPAAGVQAREILRTISVLTRRTDGAAPIKEIRLGAVSPEG
jgi:hypothetical protein